MVVGSSRENGLRNRLGSGAQTLVDSSGEQDGEIVADAHPEYFQFEKNGTRVFINVPDKKEVQVAAMVKGTTLADHHGYKLLPYGVFLEAIKNLQQIFRFIGLY